MNIDVSQHKEYIDYVSRLTGTVNFGKCKTIAFWNDKKLMAVALYNMLDESNVSLSLATTNPKWCTRKVIKVIADYPFNQLGLNRVTAVIRESNTKSISLTERIGFTKEGELRQYYKDGESAMIYGMLKDECRWLK